MSRFRRIGILLSVAGAIIALMLGGKVWRTPTTSFAREEGAPARPDLLETRNSLQSLSQDSVVTTLRSGSGQGSVVSQAARAATTDTFRMMGSPQTHESRSEDASGGTCRFSGPARVHWAPAPVGTRVEAWVDGVKAAETVVVSQGDERVYTLALDRRYAGKTVAFRFPAYPQLSQPGEAICELNTSQSLTLDAQSHTGCGGG